MYSVEVFATAQLSNLSAAIYYTDTDVYPATEDDVKDFMADNPVLHGSNPLVDGRLSDGFMDFAYGNWFD